MTLVMEGLRELSGHHDAISILAVVGPYHSGKSFLLNALVGRPNVRPPEELVVLSFDLQRNYYIKNVVLFEAT